MAKTAKDFDEAIRMMIDGDGWGMPFSVYETTMIALRISASIMRPGVVEILVPTARDAIAAIRAAITEEENPHGKTG